MQKVKFLKSPLIIAAIICFAIAIAIPLFVSNSDKKDIRGVSQNISPTLTSAPSPTNTPKPSNSYKQTSGSPTATPISAAQGVSNQQNPTSTQAPQQNSNSTANQTFQVSLKVNGSSVGNVEMQQNNNQCDVLTRAKDQGKILSLLMKYDNNLGTYGIYVINGIGKENSVWWVYKVNGQSPSQGCSYIKANSGDNVEWEYVGN